MLLWGWCVVCGITDEKKELRCYVCYCAVEFPYLHKVIEAYLN